MFDYLRIGIQIRKVKHSIDVNPIFDRYVGDKIVEIEYLFCFFFANGIKWNLNFNSVQPIIYLKFCWNPMWQKMLRKSSSKCEKSGLRKKNSIMNMPSSDSGFWLW